MKTYGSRIDDMIIKAPVGMKFALGENPKSSYNSKNQTPITRMATAALIREHLKKAQRYLEDLSAPSRIKIMIRRNMMQKAKPCSRSSKES